MERSDMSAQPGSLDQNNAYRWSDQDPSGRQNSQTAKERSDAISSIYDLAPATYYGHGQMPQGYQPYPPQQISNIQPYATPTGPSAPRIHIAQSPQYQQNASTNDSQARVAGSHQTQELHPGLSTEEEISDLFQRSHTSVNNPITQALKPKLPQKIENKRSRPSLPNLVPRESTNGSGHVQERISSPKVDRPHTNVPAPTVYPADSANRESQTVLPQQLLNEISPRKDLPYDVSSLVWNADRTLNDQHRYCYCGDDRNLLDVDVQCCSCSNFFHGRCIRLDMGPVVPFMTNYQFTCGFCSSTGTEVFLRKSCSWKSICATALANLILMRIRMINQHWEKHNYAAKHFEHLMPDLGWYLRKTDIVPFLDIPRHWAAICTEKDKSETVAWASTLGNSLVSNPDCFEAHDESNRSANSPLRLRNPNLFAFKCGYMTASKTYAPRKRKAEEIEAKVTPTPASVPISAPSPTLMSAPAPTPVGIPVQPIEAPATIVKLDQLGAVFIPPERVSQREKPAVKADDAPTFNARIPTIKKESTRPANALTKEIARERKPTAKKAVTMKKTDQSPAKLIRRPPPYKPQDFNARPKAPGKTQVEGQFANGPYFSITDIPYNKRGFKYIMCEAAPSMPAIMYRQVEVEPHEARIDWSDMSPYMYLSKDGRSATTDKGFRLGRANVVVREGQWYWEVKILRGNGDQGGHVRLGIARREASIDGPVGFDGYSYGIRDKGGEKMHLSRPRKFMESFGSGDVIGFHLSLPKAPSTEIARDRIPIRYRQQLYFEQFEYNSSKEMEDLLNPGTQTLKPTVPPILKGSFLKVYKNGKPMGTAFDNLFSFWPPNSQTQRDQPAKDDGSLGYYPAVSVYHGGAVRLNFGPELECPPQKDIFKTGSVKHISQRFDEQVAEDVVYDLMDEIDFEEDLKELSLGQQQLEVEPIREIAEYD